VDRRVGRVYEAEDDLFRLVAYRDATGRQGMTPEAATEWSRSALGNFERGRSSRAVALLRNSVVPFVHYPIAALPSFAQHLIERPWRWVALTLPLLALNEWGQAEAQHDLGKEDVAPRERDGMFGALIPSLIQVPLANDPRGRIPAMDLTRWTPVSALSTGAPPNTLAGEANTPSLFSPGGPLVSAAEILVANRASPFSREKVWDRSRPPSDNWASVASAASDLVLPSMLGFAGRRLATDIDRRDASGIALDAAGFVGLRPRYYGRGEFLKREERALGESERGIDFEAKLEAEKSRRNPERVREIGEQRRERRAAARARFEERVGRTRPPEE
jgi:hypothetical protein